MYDTTIEQLDEAESMPDLTVQQLVHMQLANTDMSNPPSPIDYIHYVARLWSYLQKVDPNYGLVLKTTYIKRMNEHEHV